MNRFFLCLTIFFTLASYAQSTPVRYFEVTEFQFSPAHFKSPTEALLKVDYAKSQVSLKVSRAMPPCPVHQVCVQMMPEPVVIELPIQSVEKNECGIFHVTAEQDFRPNDGPLSRIELNDTTEATCEAVPNGPSQATYETRSISRESGRETADISKMTLHPLASAASIEALDLIQGRLLKGFSSFQSPGSGALILSPEKVEMTIQMNMNCSHRVCPRMIPQPLHVELPIIKSENSGCGRILTAREDLQRTEGTLEEVEIQDLRNCDSAGPGEMEVHYHSIFDRGYGIYEYEAVFTFGKKSVH